MTVIGNLKRMAKRPSLLLKGSSQKTCATSNSDSDEQDGFDSPSRKQPTSRDIHFAPPSEMYGYEHTIPKARKGGRRASTGGGITSSMSLDHKPMFLGLTKAQTARIERIKNRRRSSLNMVSSSDHGTFSKYSAQLEMEPSDHQRIKYEEASPAWKRRHSLDYGKLSEKPPTPLYSIRPDPVVTRCRKPGCRGNNTTKSNNDDLTQGSWHNLGSTRSARSAESIQSFGTQQSMRSFGTQHSTGSVGTQHSAKSNGTQQSNGSVLTSIGCVVNTAPGSARKRAPPNSSTADVTTRGGAGGRVNGLEARGRQDSTRSVDSLDSIMSFGE